MYLASDFETVHLFLSFFDVKSPCQMSLMVQWYEKLLVEQEDTGLIPALPKGVFSPRVKGGKEKN